MSGGIISADFLFNREKKMRFINEMNYAKMLANENIWHPKLLRTSTIDSKSERVHWLLSTASIEQLSANDGGESGGSLNFDELATVTAEYFPAYHGRGFKIGKMKYSNFVNNGIDPAARWAGDVGTYGAKYPQRLLAQVILNGENVNGYDGVPFFSKSHPVHPLIASLGTFANLFTGAPVGASGLTPAYPGALPVDDSVSLDTAYVNFSKALAYIAGAISQPNGASDPRDLEPAFVLYPPRMAVRMAQLFEADFIAQDSAGGGGGSADVRAVWRKFRLAEPIQAKELDGSRSYTFMGPDGLPATVTGDDKTFYIVCREAQETELGAYLLTLRQPFSLHTYTGEGGTEGVDAVLGRSNDLEWHYNGWMAVNQGHPYTVFKFKGS